MLVRENALYMRTNTCTYLSGGCSGMCACTCLLSMWYGVCMCVRANVCTYVCMRCPME